MSASRFSILALLSMALAAPAGAAAQDPNILLPADSVERLLTRAPLGLPDTLRELNRRTRLGVLAFSDGTRVPVKWAVAPPRGEAFNNNPHYELAAYALQKLFLDPAEYVVPPTAVRAIPLEAQVKLDREARATLAEAASVLVVLQYFLSNVTSQGVFEPARFDADTAYARAWGNANLLTYLIAHNDSNRGNLLISREGLPPRIFAVDNGISFRAEPPDRPGEWRVLRVSRLPARAVGRLRSLSEQGLRDALGVLAQFEVREARLIEVEPGANLDAGRGIRERDGVIQLGLDEREIRDVWERVQALLRDVDRGRITLF